MLFAGLVINGHILLNMFQDQLIAYLYVAAVGGIDNQFKNIQ